MAIGPAADFFAGHFVQAPGINAAFAHVFAYKAYWLKLALFGDVFERVRSEYVDPVSSLTY